MKKFWPFILMFAVLHFVAPPAEAQLCNANLLDIQLVSNQLVAVPGEIVGFRVFVRNQSTAGGGLFIGCQVQDVDATFVCPGPLGLPNGAATVVITDGVFPADDVVHVFPPLADPAFPCVMPNVDGFATAEVTGPPADLVNEQGQIVGAVTIQKSISVNVLTTQVRVDKQVSCNGGPFQDAQLVVANDDGTNGCSAVNGQPVAVQFQASNPGEAPLFFCSMTVIQNNGTPSSFNPLAINVGNLASGAVTPIIPASNSPQACSNALELEEPDTARITCCTVNQFPCPDGLSVTAFDVATFSCIQPALNVEKTCVDDDPADGIGEVTVRVSAVGSEAALTCTAIDNIFLNDPLCPADVGTGTPIPLAPANPFVVPAGGEVVLTGLTPPLVANSCNNVVVTCTVEGSTVPLTDSASAVCPGTPPGEGCLTRTPGFWSTHPAITGEFLPQTVCGTVLNTTAAGSGNSATEAMCSVGRDGKILGPQLQQLVRQCTAALLNVAASTSGGGNCTTDIPPLAGLLDGCCGGQSVCTGDPVPGFTVEACIGQLTAFNESSDTLPPFGLFVSPGPADPGPCQDAKNNGIIVSPTP